MRLLGSFAAGISVVCSLIVACSGPPAKPAEPAETPCPVFDTNLVMAASPRANAGASGEGYPVQVRVYELTSDVALKNADFEQIWQDDANTLGEELVSVQEHTLFPDSSNSLQLPQKPQVSTIAVVALFREPHGDDWYTTYNVRHATSGSACPKEAPVISVWLDRMQIQDGAGRVDQAATTDAPEQPAANE